MTIHTYPSRLWGSACLLLFLLFGMGVRADHATAQAESSPPGELLDVEEKAWIQDNPTVTIGIWDLPPANFMENGVAKGYRVDLLETMLNRAGLKPTYRYLPLRDIIEGLREGEIDVSLSFIHTEERYTYLDYALHKVPVNIAIYARKSREDISDTASLERKVIASYQGYALDKALKKTFPDATIIQAEDKPGMFQLVATGKADFCVQERESLLITFDCWNKRRGLKSNLWDRIGLPP